MGGQSESRSKDWGGLGGGMTVVLSGAKAKNTETFNYAVVKLWQSNQLNKLWKLERFILKTLQLYTIINYYKTGFWYSLWPSFELDNQTAMNITKTVVASSLAVILWYYSTIILLIWCYDTIILLLWYYDTMTLLYNCYDTMILWYYGTIILLLWYYDTMILLLWYSDAMILLMWYYDTFCIILWYYGPTML